MSAWQQRIKYIVVVYGGSVIIPYSTQLGLLTLLSGKRIPSQPLNRYDNGLSGVLELMQTQSISAITSDS